LWVELTSKCPFDCIFCSRKTRRGTGQHLPFPVYERMVQELPDARKFILNYSGESMVYPDLIPAIQLARASGAFVELVSALATAPESMLAPLAESGLNRLTASVHATDPSKYAEIYRYSSVETLHARLERLVELCKARKQAPAIDLAFVAMDTNLSQLPSVASLADSLGLRDIFIFPVMRRDEIPVQFPTELAAAGTHQQEFINRVRGAASRTTENHPEIRLTICNESFTTSDAALGEVPRPYPGVLPPGSRIHSCEQNPWETAHVLSNGDVVACEVLDNIPLGNLHQQSISEIWHGKPYQNFRERYHLGEIAECRGCPWKRAYVPGPLGAEIIASRGLNAQLLHGWHAPAGEDHIWSSQQAAAVLSPRFDSRVLHISGILPPGPEGEPNELTIEVNGVRIGQVENPRSAVLPFGLNFEVADQQGALWTIEFRTTHVYRPTDHATSSDQRDLGFALVLIVAKALEDSELIRQRELSLQTLVRFIHRFDGWGRLLNGVRRHTGISRPILRPGLSVIIPERDNIAELQECLRGLRDAAEAWPEPIETTVVVNGSREHIYDALRKQYPQIRWIFEDQPLGFAKAVHIGLRLARHDWIYLLNSDAVLDGGALCALAPYREPSVFSIASQILLKDTTRFREETNWTSLWLDSGIATIHDWIPRSQVPVETFYAGGGASLFQTKLLRRFLETSAYSPFYWEDVEWGWRARKLGYRSLFCPASIAHHRQRATVLKHYTAKQVEMIVRRNQFLFQLRNLTSAGSLSRVIEEIASSPEEIAGYFLDRRTWWKIAVGRLWNHTAPIKDDEVFNTWNNLISNC
jgi:MoaA/NifB/PqqE/SkfB family radical SAM enzyme/GT2 family glycosyltransferase